MRGTAVLALLLVASPAVPGAAPSAQPLPSTTPEKAGLSPERLARIDRFLNDQIERRNLPGAVVLVARDGRVAYFKSFGFVDAARVKRLPQDAIFRMGSMTKPWVSVAAMMLVEEGRLQLGDPISIWLPEFKAMRVIAPHAEGTVREATTTPAEREITVYDLLRHTAGLTYAIWEPDQGVKDAYVKAGFGPGADWQRMTRAEVVKRLSTVPLVNQPGAAYNYGLSGDVLGFVIEAATGMPLAEFLRERLFSPLQMRDSGFRVAREELDRVARPLPVDPRSGKPNPTVDVTAEKTTDSGGTGGLSTAGDYARFVQMILAGGQLEGRRILSRASVRLMTSDQLGPGVAVRGSSGGPPALALGSPGYTFGLGFAIRTGEGPADVLGSTGEFVWGGAAGGTLFWGEPRERLIGIFMAQASPSDFGYYRAVVKNLVEAAVLDRAR